MTPDQLNTLFALADNAADAAGFTGLQWVAFELHYREGFQGLPESRSLVAPDAAHKGYLAGWDAYGRRWADMPEPVRLHVMAAFLDAFQAYATAQAEARRAA